MTNWKTALTACAGGALALSATAGALAPASPARADVKAGVDAWAQGDYARAVAQWRPLAQTGDADAQFNLGQAYKLGRGVPADAAAALEWFRKAAVQGHSRAEDNYGLLLFQQGRRQEAMPYLQRSAGRGEPRAQYLVGTALFNGDYLARDWVRAYALISRSAASGVSQAADTLKKMDGFLSESERTQGLALAARMAADSQGPADDSPLRPAAKPDAPARLATAPKPPAPRPTPIRTVPVPPAAHPTPAPTRVPLPVAKPAKAPPAAKAPAEKAPTPVGAWRIQLGAFGEKSRAEHQWKTLSASIKGLSGKRPALEKAGAMTRLLAGPFASRAEAEKLCAAVRASGGACFVKAP